MRIPHPHLSGRTKLAVVGTAVGAAMTYILGKPTLRKELQEAESTKEAMEILGKHVKRDSAELSQEAREYMQSPVMQRRWNSMKRWVNSKRTTARSKAEQVKNKVARKAADAAHKVEKMAEKHETASKA